MLEVQIQRNGKELYRLQIENVTLPKRKDFSPFAAYAAELSGPGLAKPLRVRVNKFDRQLGAAKLVSRILARLFHKHMDQLADLKEK